MAATLYTRHLTIIFLLLLSGNIINVVNAKSCNLELQISDNKTERLMVAMVSNNKYLIKVALC